MQEDRETHKETDRQANRHTHYTTSQPYRGDVKILYAVTYTYRRLTEHKCNEIYNCTVKTQTKFSNGPCF